MVRKVASVNDGRIRRLGLEWSIALGGGLLSSLIAFLDQAHPVVALSIGVLVCAMITVLGIALPRKRAPLAVKIEDMIWETLNSAFWALALKVDMKNRTSRSVKIVSCESVHEASDGTLVSAQLSDEDSRAVEYTADSKRYFPPLLRYPEIPARRSVSGWYVTPVARNPAGGTPKCIITVIDEIGNRYKLVIPAQEPHTYWA
jgi:hypothetical protein